MPTVQQQFTPEAFRGNWQRRDSFSWFVRPDDAEEFGLWILSHRDSGLLYRSNEAVIRRLMRPYEASGDVLFLIFNHWAYGYTHEIAVRAYRPGTQQTTEAFDAFAEIVARLEDYPVLDDGDYGEKEYESALEGIRLSLLGGEIKADRLPDGWEHEVYNWLSEYEPSEMENRDDQGAFPSRESVLRALSAMNLIHDRVEEE